MPFDWTSESSQGEKMGEGYHYVKATKIIYGKKNGDRFQSKDGSPQMMVIFENSDGEEVSSMFTLSEKAGWVLAMFMIRAGADAEKMNSSGVTPQHFADKDFAEKQILGREVWVYVRPKGQYADVDFCNEEDVPEELVARRRKGMFKPASVQQTSQEPLEHQPVADEDIPF